jgi:hypothetical protein
MVLRTRAYDEAFAAQMSGRVLARTKAELVAVGKRAKDELFGE